jgi:competence protein ComEC
LAWTISIVRWTASFSWAQVELPAFPWWLMALSYLTLGGAVWWLQQPATQRRPSVQKNQVSRSTTFMAGGLAILAILIWSATRGLPDGKLHVAFLDIGQGDAILITTPHGRQILIDGGPSPAQLGQRLGEEMPFWDHSLDMIVNTHPDADHLGGLVEMLERYEVGTILVSDAASGSALYREWLNQLETDHQSPITAWQDMTLQLDEDVQAIVLNPGPASRMAEAPNDHSVVIKLVMGKISFLLTGDIEAEVERRLAASELALGATVLKSAHHGSKSSSIPQFLDRVDPQIVVISAGVDNQFGHPHPEILQRYVDYGVTILRTDESGTVELITDGERIWAEVAR